MEGVFGNKFKLGVIQIGILADALGIELDLEDRSYNLKEIRSIFKKALKYKKDNPFSVLIANAKGGVGKTTLSYLIGTTATLLGYKTLLIDFDRQKNLTSKLLGYEATPKTILDFYLNNNKGIEEIVTKVDEGLDLIAGSEDLAELEALFAHEMNSSKLNINLLNIIKRRKNRISENESAFGDALERIKGNYDLIVIDMGPTTGQVMRAGAYCADHLIVPIVYEEDSVAGVSKVVSIHRDTRSHKGTDNHEDTFTVLPNDYLGFDQSEKDFILNYFEDVPDNVLQSEMPFLPVLRKNNKKGSILWGQEETELAELKALYKFIFTVLNRISTVSKKEKDNVAKIISL